MRIKPYPNAAQVKCRENEKGDAKLLEVLAHAKINFTLDVLGIRPDGYHEVEMVMQSLQLHDRLLFKENDRNISIKCDCPDVPTGTENLVCRAADLLRDYTGCNSGAEISISKKIPVAAGLAGGSADAAAALYGLNLLWELGLSGQELQQLGQRLGADIPFCLTGGTVLARGIGERLEILPPAPQLGVVLVKPLFGVSTATVYRLFDTMPANRHPDTAAMAIALRNKDIGDICESLYNVLEPVTSSIHPEILKLKQELLKAGAAGALMSGSGPTVYGLCADEPSAREVAGNLDVRDCTVIVTTTSRGKIRANLQ